MSKNILNKKNLSDILSLTSLQQGILFHYISSPKDTSYINQLVIKFESRFDIDKFNFVWAEISKANEAIRSVFKWEKIDKPVQIVLKEMPINTTVHDLRNNFKEEQNEKIDSILEADYLSGFKLQNESFRINVLLTSDNTYTLVITNHHILYDGWSTGILLKEFVEGYNNLIENKEFQITKKASLRKFRSVPQDVISDKHYWKTYLDGFEFKEDIYDVIRKSKSDEEEKVYEYSYIISDEIHKKIKQYISDNRLSLSTLIYTSWGILIQKYTRNNDILFGTTTSGRNQIVDEIEKTVDLFINTIPLRFKSNSENSILDALIDTQRMIAERMEHEKYSLVEILRESNAIGNRSFESLVVVENYPIDKDLLNTNTLKIKDYYMKEETHYSLVLAVSEHENLELKLQYKSSISKESIQSLITHFVNIIQEIVYRDKIYISEIDMLESREKAILLNEFQKKVQYSSPKKKIHEYFKAQVELTPNNIALCYEGQTMTYKELDRISDLVSKRIYSTVGNGGFVGFVSDRSMKMVVGILSILKSGNAYVPIDHEYPIERQLFMMNDCKAKVILMNLKEYNFECFQNFCLLDLKDLMTAENIGTIDIDKKNNFKGLELAYMIYTSGSTGNPKGVVVEHATIMNTLLWRNKYYNFSEEDVFLQIPSFSFDSSVEDIFCALLCGAKLVIINAVDRLIPSKMSLHIRNNLVTHALMVPNYYETMLDEMDDSLTTLKYITVAGEKVSLNLIKKHFEKFPKVRLFNEYGPTECSVCATACELFKHDRVASIGKPIEGVNCYVLDESLNLMPINIPGELYITGLGVAKGYFNNLELTEAKYKKNPFDKRFKMYKTGDLVKWNSEGSLEFIGRVDDQVKINGYRIEIGEIEERIIEHESINKCAVIVLENDNKKILCAYFSSSEALDIMTLKKWVEQKLPNYMIPNIWIPIDNLPLSANGKIDKKALPKVVDNVSNNIDYRAPLSDLEIKIADIWKEILDIHKVSVNDNFFEIGGNSLKAISLIGKMQKNISVEISIRQIFITPTISSLASFITSETYNPYSEIEVIDYSDHRYPMSSSQQRIYSLQQMIPESTSYNMPAIFEVKGELDQEKFAKTIEKLVLRHDAFRTSFELDDEKGLVQVVHKDLKFEIEKIASTEGFVRSFDLSKAPLLRVGIHESETTGNHFMFDMHHIISDGESIRVMIEEFVRLYQGETLSPLRIQYKDFSVWQQGRMEESGYKVQADYWKDQYKDEIPVLDLSTDYVRPSLQSHEGDRYELKLPQALSEKLKQLAQNQDVTYFMFMFASLNVWLSKYSGQEDMVVGTPIVGRPHADLEQILGMFVNTLAIRSQPKGEKSFESYLKEMKEILLRGIENSEYPFERLVEEVSVSRDFSRNPLFDVMFLMQNEEKQAFELEGLTLSSVETGNKISKFDMSISVLEETTGDKIRFEYCTKLFKEQSIIRMAEGFVNLLEEIVERHTQPISELSVLSETERNRIIYEFNQTESDYEINDTLHQMIERQALKTPNEIAIRDSNKAISYSELDSLSSKLASILIAELEEKQEIIPVLMEKSVDQMIAFNGIMKSGNAYLPIDITLPEDRIRYMLKDSGSKVILVNGKVRVDSYSDAAKIIDISSLNYDEMKRVTQLVDPASPAYVIYTSGSTGQPKGVVISHQSAVNLVYGYQNEVLKQYSKRLVLGMVTPPHFDASIKIIYPALAFGHELALISDDIKMDYEALTRYLSEHQVEILDGTPSYLQEYIASKSFSVESLKVNHYVIGGEALTKALVYQVMDKYAESKPPRITNVYGPTECTDISTMYTVNSTAEVELNSGTSVVIGRPIANVEGYILDKWKKATPIGVVGELHISGAGLAISYLNQPELTRDKFIENPYKKSQKMYRTGDLCRWLPDGRIEYVGRIDHQVKIRGYRIELGEIDHHLGKHANITNVLTVAKEEKDGSKVLCGYYTTEDGENISKELRAFLSQKLPEYMIPTHLVHMKQMPLTSNGKIDRKALPEPSEMERGIKGYVSPRTKLESDLQEIWKEILGVNDIGVQDHFFEIGGHSLKATALAGKINKRLGYEIRLRQIFEAPTIEGLAKLIEQMKENPYSEIEVIDYSDHRYPMSSSQQRIYSLQQMIPESTSYNMPAIFEVKGELDQEKFAKTIEKLVLRHDAFRTSFELDDEKGLVQVVHKDLKFEIEKIASTEGFVRSFDLSKAPLLRVGIHESETTGNHFMFDMHHIISDGESIRVMIEEFVRLYQGETLSPLRIQYKDFSVWQQGRMEESGYKVQADYWKDQYKDEIPVLDLSTDYVRPSLQSHEGDRYELKLPQALSEKLKQLAQNQDVTYFMFMFASLNVWLSKYSGQEDMVVGTPIVGRPHADLEQILGMFVNTLAIRSQPKGEKSFESYLKEMKEILLRGIENSEYPFERLVEEVSVSRDFSRNPLFDVMFLMQNEEKQAFELEGLTLSSVETGNKISKFDMSISVLEETTGDKIRFEYCTKLFKEQSIIRMAEGFVNLLEEIVERHTQPISELSVLSETERNRIIYEFNQTEREYDRNATLYALFEAQVKNSPNAIAVIFEDQEYTYVEVEARINAIENYFVENNVKKGDVVAVMLERSVDLICTIMGLFKLGSVYLPIDIETPKERVEFVLEDSHAKIVVVDTKTMAVKDRLSEHIICLNVGSCNTHQVKTIKKYKPNFDSEHSAYIIYTSGSTGQPKGVEISHRALVNFSCAAEKILFGKGGNSVLAVSSYTFDISMFELTVPLLTGNEIILANQVQSKDLLALAVWLEKIKVDIVQLTPSRLMGILLAKENSIWMSQIKKMILCGEVFPYSEIDYFNQKGFKGKLFNMYGPTETTIWSTRELVDKKSIESIGVPMDNTQILILDRFQNVVSIGVKGEMYIGGEGLANGYVNRENLTLEKFIFTPHLDRKVYKTGDLCRWLPDGRIEYVGRIDHQVKIRGYRIELGEIDHHLGEHANITNVLTVAKEEKDGSKVLCGYYTTEDGENISKELRAFLSQKLPEYMIPTHLVHMKQMPLTSNGKIDRKALPEPSEMQRGIKGYVSPRTKLESDLQEIWKEILDVNDIGVQDHFFEIGGHSLKATALAGKINKRLGYEIRLRQIFEAPTIEGLAKLIEQMKENPYSEIEVIDYSDHRYPMSSSQQRIYSLQQMIPESTSYNMPAIFEVKGELDQEKFAKIIEKLVLRHDAFRTSFELDDEKGLVQVVHKDLKFEIEKIASIEGFVRSFDLSKAPLLRVGIHESETTGNHLMFDMHHIISDGESIRVMIEEFVRLYQGETLSPLRIQYKDFSVWQQGRMEESGYKVQADYWKDQYKDEIPVLDLSTDYVRPSLQSHEGDRYELKLPQALSEKLKQLAQNQDVTYFMFMFASLNVWLSKYSGQEDMVVGTPIVGRPHADLEQILGMFVNTLAIRSQPKGEKSFESYLKEMKEILLRGIENSEYPFERLVEEVSVSRDFSRNPLFDVMFLMQNEEKQAFELEGLTLSSVETGNKISKFDMSISVLEETTGDKIRFEYCTKLFKEQSIIRMAEGFVNLLEEIVERHTQPISELSVLSETERNRIIYEFNQTESDYEINDTLHQMIERQALKTPNEIAIRDSNKAISYSELDSLSSKLASILIAELEEKQEIIPVLMEKSVDQMIAFTGIMKSGNAYLPIDITLPEDRIRYMLKDSGSKVILVNGKVRVDSYSDAAKIIDISSLNYDEMKRVTRLVDPASPAYVIYTSGSTGQPKGVVISHQSAVNLVYGYQNEVLKQYSKRLVLGMVTPPHFDASINIIYPALAFGHELALISDDIKMDYEALTRYLSEHQVEILDGTPSYLQEYIASKSFSVKSLKVNHYVIGGEALTKALVYQVMDKYAESKPPRITNLYGPTECTDISTMYTVNSTAEVELNSGTSVVIGRPIANVEGYILDKWKKATPIGVVGELHISGAGLAISYLNQPELTRDKFIENPYKKSQKMYRTGDLCRWLPDGRIEYVGRIDHQVKIRGYRIELGEIDHHLGKHANITNVLTVAKEEKDGSKVLCGYYTTEDGENISKELRAFLSQKLPEYMIPTHLVHMKQMPLTSNGKIDLKMLMKFTDEYVQTRELNLPQNPIEVKLNKIWKEVLELQSVDVEDDFFDIGGNSLKALRLIDSINKIFSVKIKFKEFMQNRSIRQMSMVLEHSNIIEVEVLKKAETKPYYKVSSAQLRLWIQQQINPNSMQYNMTQIIKVVGGISNDRFEKALVELIIRHEALRASFDVINEDVVQINNSVESIKHSDLFKYIKTTEHDVEAVINDQVRTFNLKEAPLIRVSMIQASEDLSYVVFDVHHIITDGYSMQILIKDFFDLYENRELNKLTYQYTDYSEWHNNYIESEFLDEGKEFWLEKMKSFNLTKIETGNVYDNSSEVSASISVLNLNCDLTNQLKQKCINHQVTLYALMLGVFKLLVSKYTGNNDIIVGTPYHGRSKAELDEIVGVFINVMPIRYKIDMNSNFDEFIKDFYEELITYQNYLEYPYERLYSNLKENNIIENEELFTLLFNYIPEKKVLLGNSFNIIPIVNNKMESKYDITFYVRENDEVEITCVYKKALYSETFISKLLDDYKVLFEQILESRSSLKDLIINENEIILENWNDFYENDDFFTEGL